MIGSLFTKQQHELPRAPVEYADEVELYARLSGRHATLHFVPAGVPRGGAVTGFWIVRFTLRDGDKRLKLYQEGKVANPPTDDCWLIDRHGQALDLAQLGVSGLRAFLEKGSLTSGRGEYASMEDQLRKVREHNAHVAEKARADAKEDNRKEQMDRRRSRLDIPVITPGIDLRGKGEPTGEPVPAGAHDAGQGASSHTARPPEQQE